MNFNDRENVYVVTAIIQNAQSIILLQIILSNYWHKSFLFLACCCVKGVAHF